MPSIYKYRLLLFLALFSASAASVGMVGARYLYSGHPAYTFLIWNLFLAWLPLGFAFVAFQFSHRPLIALPAAAAWLLFLPNAPYLITDLIHLRPWPNVPHWYDAIMFFTIATTGLFLGFTSLYLMHKVAARLLGPTLSWLFVLASLVLTSFGVYVGRFLRWNSWDVFFNPIRLGRDLLDVATDPLLRLQIVVITLSFMVLFLFAYVILLSLPRITTDH
jgi:uncharacterized membrane protein